MGQERVRDILKNYHSSYSSCSVHYNKCSLSVLNIIPTNTSHKFEIVMENVTNVTIFVTGNFIQWYQVNGLCSDPDEPRSHKIEFMDSHILWIVLQGGSLMTTAIIIPIIILHNTLNNVIRNIMLITVTINLLELLINFSLGTLFLLDCDLDTITQGRHLILHKSYQMFSIWTLVTYSTLTYELSRTRYYFAKHAFRIHKLSTLHISAQVILEAIVLSTSSILIYYWSTNISLFANFPSLYNIDKVDRNHDITVFTPVIIANVFASIYYFKLCQHVKKRFRSVGVSGVRKNLPNSADKYVTDNYKETLPPRPVKSPAPSRMMFSEIAFIMMSGSQIFIMIIFIILTFLHTDPSIMDFSLKCVITFLHTIMTHTVLIVFVMVEFINGDKKKEGERLQRRLKKTSKHRRHLSRTRQAFKLPRWTSRTKPSEDEHPRTELNLEIFTVFNSSYSTSDNQQSDLVPPPPARQTLAWSDERDLEKIKTQSVVKRFCGTKRQRFKGSNKDDIIFSDIATEMF